MLRYIEWYECKVMFIRGYPDNISATINNPHIDPHFDNHRNLKQCAQKLAPKSQGVICFEKFSSMSARLCRLGHSWRYLSNSEKTRYRTHFEYHCSPEECAQKYVVRSIELHTAVHMSHEVGVNFLICESKTLIEILNLRYGITCAKHHNRQQCAST